MRKEIKRLTKSEKFELSQFVVLYDKMAHSYFYKPPVTAYQRRGYEESNTIEHVFNFNGVKYEIGVVTTCSCKNVYTTRYIRVDDKKKNINVIKDLLK